jgi:hypothetical protein
MLKYLQKLGNKRAVKLQCANTPDCISEPKTHLMIGVCKIVTLSLVLLYSFCTSSKKEQEKGKAQQEALLKRKRLRT